MQDSHRSKRSDHPPKQGSSTEGPFFLNPLLLLLLLLPLPLSARSLWPPWRLLLPSALAAVLPPTGGFPGLRGQGWGWRSLARLTGSAQIFLSFLFWYFLFLTISDFYLALLVILTTLMVMSTESVRGWKCDHAGCGHVWLAKVEPKRCAKCKKANWNRVGDVEKLQESSPVVPSEKPAKVKTVVKTDAVGTTGSKVTIAEPVVLNNPPPTRPNWSAINLSISKPKKREE